MIRCPSLLRNLIPLARMQLMLLMDVGRLLRLCLHPNPTLAAEHLLLRQQLYLVSGCDGMGCFLWGLDRRPR